MTSRNDLESEFFIKGTCAGIGCVIGFLMIIISLMFFLFKGLPALIQNNSEFIKIYYAWLDLIFIVIGIIIIVITWKTCGKRTIEINKILKDIDSHTVRSGSRIILAQGYTSASGHLIPVPTRSESQIITPNNTLPSPSLN